MQTNTNNIKIARSNKYAAVDLLRYKKKPLCTPIIIDTDLGNDIDDALALILAHSLQSNGECEILGVAINKDNNKSAAMVDIINTFYKRPNIAIGVVKNGKTPENGMFLKQIVDAKIDGKDKYLRTYNTYDLNAVRLYRKLLSKSDDNSVVIVSIGFFTNLAMLLESCSDEYSPLKGAELVARKVKFLSAMAGDFSAVNRKPEYNIKFDINSARYCCENWPTPIIFSGNEVGSQILYPAESINRDFDWVENHPLKEAYHLYGKMPYDRPTWDLTSVLYAVRPHSGYFNISENGIVQIDDKGISVLKIEKSGLHRCLSIEPSKIELLQNVMIDLCSQKPGVIKSAL
jgi:inosine-uridine nucleoside N-ribohydrolase